MKMNFIWDNFKALEIEANTIVFDENGYREDLSAFLEEGIDFKKNKLIISKTLEFPMHIIASGKTDFKIDLAKNVSVKIFHSLVESSKISLTLKDYSNCFYLNCGEISKNLEFNFEANLKSGANLQSLNFFNNKGSADFKTLINAEENSSTQINSLYHNHKDFKLDITGINQGSDSSVFIKSKIIAFEKSESDLSAMSKIEKNLANAKNKISFNCLSSGKIKKMKILPAQDILSSDVEASHGMSFGGFDKKALIYILTFGLSEKEALLCLLNAFQNDIFNLVQDENLESKIKKFIGVNL